MRTETRPWGWYEVLYESETQWLKKIHISPGQSLSLQAHKYREETWVTETEGIVAVIGEDEIELSTYYAYHVSRGVRHRLTNTGQTEATVIEWAYGRPDESDIIRYEDNYGRA